MHLSRGRKAPCEVCDFSCQILEQARARLDEEVIAIACNEFYLTV